MCVPLPTMTGIHFIDQGELASRMRSLTVQTPLSSMKTPTRLIRQLFFDGLRHPSSGTMAM